MCLASSAKLSEGPIVARKIRTQHPKIGEGSGSYMPPDRQASWGQARQPGRAKPGGGPTRGRGHRRGVPHLRRLLRPAPGGRPICPLSNARPPGSGTVGYPGPLSQAPRTRPQGEVSNLCAPGDHRRPCRTTMRYTGRLVKQRTWSKAVFDGRRWSLSDHRGHRRSSKFRQRILLC